ERSVPVALTRPRRRGSFQAPFRYAPTTGRAPSGGATGVPPGAERRENGPTTVQPALSEGRTGAWIVRRTGAADRRRQPADSFFHRSAPVSGKLPGGAPGDREGVPAEQEARLVVGLVTRGSHGTRRPSRPGLIVNGTPPEGRRR